MNIEDTVAFILESQSKAQERLNRADARMDRAEARMDRFDKQLAATRKLVELGMKSIMRLADENRQTKAELRELARAHKETERVLQAFIKSLNKGTNGRR